MPVGRNHHNQSGLVRWRPSRVARTTRRVMSLSLPLFFSADLLLQVELGIGLHSI
jgi:hypothetical protein